jgi:hypothetical protein
MSSQYVIPESTATIEYPASKRKKIIDHKGKVIYDSNNDIVEGRKYGQEKSSPDRY